MLNNNKYTRTYFMKVPSRHGTIIAIIDVCLHAMQIYGRAPWLGDGFVRVPLPLEGRRIELGGPESQRHDRCYAAADVRTIFVALERCLGKFRHLHTPGLRHPNT
jgi:hypothetical protein